MVMAEISIITWEGRDIRLSYSPRWCTQIDHIEVQSVDGRPLPITETGYKSHFFGPVEPIMPMSEIEAMVRAWLDSEARKPSWQHDLLTSQQLSLF